MSRKLYDEVYVIGLDLRFVCRFVSADGAAFAAFMDYDISFFRVRLRRYRVHDAAAFGGSVAGVYIEVERTKTARAVISRRIPEREDLKTAVFADKAAVVFGEKLLFHLFVHVNVELRVGYMDAVFVERFFNGFVEPEKD